MSLTLYFHPLASFCHKVLVALYESAIPFQGRIIDLGNAGDRAEITALWPVGKFPVLRDEQRKRTVPESSVIVEYLCQHFAGAADLLPHDADVRLDQGRSIVNAVTDHCHNIPSIDQLFYTAPLVFGQ